MADKGKPRIFLCHAKEDKARAIELYNQLKAAGYSPWLDKYDLLPGRKWWPEIRKIISDTNNLVVVCLSQNSITKRGVVQQEIKRALDVWEQTPEGAIYLIPARLEPCEVPEPLSDLHWVDLFEPDGFEFLIRSLDFEISYRKATARPEPIRQAMQAEISTPQVVPGDLVGAIADYDKAIELDPDEAAAYRNRGMARRAQGDLVGAIADYSKAIELKPDYAAAYNSRGIARWAQGDLVGAIADYDKAIELDPDEATAYHNRGIARRAQGDLAGAIADYSKAIELKPDYADAYHSRGIARREQGDLLRRDQVA